MFAVVFSIDNSNKEEKLSWLVDRKVVSLLLTGLPRISFWRIWYWSALPQQGGEYSVHFVQSNKKNNFFNVGNGFSEVQVVFHKYSVIE